MKLVPRYWKKLTLMHGATLQIAIAELKVFDVPLSEYYPAGFKYSMFLVLKDSGRVLLGFDNHKPKGPHLHLHGREMKYEFQDLERLIEDFWKMVRKEGYSI